MIKLRKTLSSLLALLTIFGNASILSASADTVYQKGDITGDGAINVTDINILSAHVKGLRSIGNNYDDVNKPYTRMWAADVNRDGQINVADVTIISAHVKGLKNISSSTNAYKNVNKMTTPTETDIISRALRLSEANLKYYTPKGNETRNYDFTKGNAQAEAAILNKGIDCSGIVNYALGSLDLRTEGLQGSNNDNAAQFNYSPASTGDWLNNYNVLKNVTNAYWVSNGVRMPMQVLKNGVSTAKQKYYRYGSNNATIPVGSIVVAFAIDSKGNRVSSADHMWIYLGEYNNANEVRNYIASLTEKTSGNVKTKIGSQKIGYSSNDNDGKHWRLESTGTWHGFDNYSGPQVNNDLCPPAKTQYLIYVFAPPTF